jgi:hypothetical protein
VKCTGWENLDVPAEVSRREREIERESKERRQKIMAGDDIYSQTLSAKCASGSR